MNRALEDMLRPSAPTTAADWNHAVREVTQEIALLGFWRSGFFEHAAFYGGTALRMFHGLNRFSEDLDFSLIDPESEARLERALAAVQTELAAWGFSFEAEPKSTGERTGIESAFLKGNTRVNLLHIGVPEELGRRFARTSRITIKLELDTNPPPFASTEIQTRLLPVPFTVRIYDLPSLFAGKLHAVLYRDWKSRVKGRDFYDFVWYVSRNVPVNLSHLDARMRQSGYAEPAALTMGELREILARRIRAVDLDAAAEEVMPFLRDARETELWSEGFFLRLCEQVRGANQ
jgi:predicted nucleotidyltransferase component of viral defense system